jgi:membrane-associated HD superfamily phosphohydrolase
MNELYNLSLEELKKQYHNIDKVKYSEKALALYDEIQKRKILTTNDGAQDQEILEGKPVAIIVIAISTLIKLGLCIFAIVYFGPSPQNVEAILPTILFAIIILFSIKFRKGLVLRICLFLDILIMIGGQNNFGAIISIFLLILSFSSNSKAYLRRKEIVITNKNQDTEIDSVS